MEYNLSVIIDHLSSSDASSAGSEVWSKISNSPESIPIQVDFPAPLAPRNDSTSPFLTLKLISAEILMMMMIDDDD